VKLILWGLAGMARWCSMLPGVLASMKELLSWMTILRWLASLRVARSF